MDTNPFLGILLHSIGGVAAASFYLPLKKVQNWSWENYWLMQGFFSWIIAPWILAMLIVPQTLSILREIPLPVLFWTYFFGVLWGIGGLTFGLTMRYLGIALGYAIALGLCAVFGTLIPPVYEQFLGDGTSDIPTIVELLTTNPGQVILLGVFVCLAGIALSGKAGMCKERELSDEQKKDSVQEFNFVKGVVAALSAGVMSASMAYAFSAGKSIGELAVQQGAPSLWQNLPVLIVALLGGFTTNFVWCSFLMLKKKTISVYVGIPSSDEKIPLLGNYIFCALGGLTWYMQFFFYSMGTTKMGKYEFSSWTLHMASIIIFSTLWGILIKEWKGTGRQTRMWIAMGLIFLILSTVIIGYGNKLG